MQEVFHHHRPHIAFEHSTLSEDSHLQTTTHISSDGLSSCLNGSSPLESQQRRCRSISTQSRSSLRSTDSLSTTATATSSITDPPRNPQESKNVGQSRQRRKRINSHQQKQRQITMMKISETRPPYSASSNSMYLENGEPSKQRLGIDPRRDPNSSSKSRHTSFACRGVHDSSFRRTPVSSSPLNNTNWRLSQSSTMMPMSESFVPPSSFSNQRRSNQHRVSFATSPSNHQNIHHDSNNHLHSVVSPCSTCSSSTTPEATRRYNHPPPPPTAMHPTTMSNSSFNDVNVDQHNDDHYCDAISPFSPSTLSTPSHPHHYHHFPLNQTLPSSSTSQLSSFHRFSHPNGFTESQARVRQSNDINNDRHSNVSCNIDKLKTFSNNQSAENVLMEDNERNSIHDDHNVNKSNGKIPIITPVKTGKKVQYRKTKVCPWNGHGRCVMGDKCNYAHSKIELRGRPDLTRTRLCPDGGSCTKSQCRFAHDAAQLRATGAFFRTKLCKFWMRGSCPSGDHCRHAHGEDQLRHPQSIGPESQCESPREAVLLSELCSTHITEHPKDMKRNDNKQTKSSPQFNKKLGQQEFKLDNENLSREASCYQQSYQPAPSPTSSFRSSHVSFASSPSTAERHSFYQKHITEPCLSFTERPSTTILSNTIQPVVGSQPVHDEQNDSFNSLPPAQSMFSVDRRSLTSMDKTTTAANLLANLSDEELTAAVSDYLLLSTHRVDSIDSATFNDTAERHDAPTLTSPKIVRPSMEQTDDANDDAMNRLVEALTSATMTDDNNKQKSSDALINRHSLNETLSPSTNYINNQIDFPLTSSDASLLRSPTAYHHLTSEQPPLMFPSPDVETSTTELKLNDILNIAVASQDPDLLECSAKILRASLQYKKKQQQQQLQQSSHTAPLFVTRSSFATSLAPSTSTTSTAVSSLPSSPRLTLYGHQSLFEHHNNTTTQSLWGARKSE